MIVDIKGVGKAQFPDEMPINDIRTFLRNKYYKDATQGTSNILDPRPQTIEPYNPSLVEKAVYDKESKNYNAYEAYKRLAGETEARNVQTRINMTPEERRSTPPWVTFDVPEDELIYRKE